MNAIIDSARLRLVQPKSSPASNSNRLPRHRAGERFLKGPIPWPWIAAAASLPGRALHVGLAIWLMAGIKKHKTVPLSLTSISKEIRCSRSTASRGLHRLEDAGLVDVRRAPGRKPVVTLLGLPGGAP